VAAPVVAEAPVVRPRRRFKLRFVVLPVLLIVLAVGAYYGYNAYHESTLYVSTENAQLTGQPVQVGSMNAGRVDVVYAKVGRPVKKGDSLAQIALPSQVGTTQNGAARMAFTGDADSHVDVEAPFDGVVISVPVAVGSTVAVAQAVAVVMDPHRVWVNANIEETNISKVQVGQPVIVHVDAADTDVIGRVEAITPATAASFSLLPSSNASGNFNKVTQLVPVRVAVDLADQPALLGSSVEVKIRVAD
jgi:multidrug resistance efflux pump